MADGRLRGGVAEQFRAFPHRPAFGPEAHPLARDTALKLGQDDIGTGTPVPDFRAVATSVFGTCSSCRLVSEGNAKRASRSGAAASPAGCDPNDRNKPATRRVMRPHESFAGDGGTGDGFDSVGWARDDFMLRRILGAESAAARSNPRIGGRVGPRDGRDSKNMEFDVRRGTLIYRNPATKCTRLGDFCETRNRRRSTLSLRQANPPFCQEVTRQ